MECLIVCMAHAPFPHFKRTPPPFLKEKQASNNVHNNTARSAVSVISEHSNDE